MSCYAPHLRLDPLHRAGADAGGDSLLTPRHKGNYRCARQSDPTYFHLTGSSVRFSGYAAKTNEPQQCCDSISFAQLVPMPSAS
jgi:hypothetical protein